MRVKVQQADLRLDRPVIIDAARRLLTTLSDSSRFSWLYEESSPHGPARAWFAQSAEDGTIIGMAGAFPRKVYIEGREELVWVLGDFCISDRYRSLGPALQLQRACLGVMESHGGKFCYDFPSASMLAVYKRLGLGVVSKMLRLAKPLRVDRRVKRIIRSPAAQRIAACVGNAVLKAASPNPRVDQRVEISIQSGPCAEEFTVLMHELQGRVGICIQRSAEYLNWRYVRNPVANHEIITARKNGRLLGYVVWTQKEDDALIVDLFAQAEIGIVRRLLAEVVALAQKRSVMTLSASVNESHPWLGVFSELGFHVRESAPVVVVPSKTFAQKLEPQLTGWYLMQGDRDS